MTKEEAIEYLEHYKKVKYGMMPEWVWDMAIKALEQEPKAGHWIFKDEDDKVCSIYTCDKCGEQIIICDDTIKSPQEGRYNFCPNCGCRMLES